MKTKTIPTLLATACVATSANAAIVSLLADPTSAVTSEDWASGPLSNLWAGDHDDVGSTLLTNMDTAWQPGGAWGGATISTGSDSDGYAGDTINSHTIVFNMGSTVSFSGFVHAQRHQAAGDSVKTMQFWATNSDPGSDTVIIANTYFGTTPDASVDVNIGNRHLHSYEFGGTELTGQYVVMRWISNGTANPGGYVFQLAESNLVPEPSSAALLGLGGLALILRRRK